MKLDEGAPGGPAMSSDAAPDIVKRLRLSPLRYGKRARNHLPCRTVEEDAAAEIERLRALLDCVGG